MTSSTPRTGLRFGLLLTLLLVAATGCRAIATILMIPVAVVAVIFGGMASIFVSADGPLADEAELRAGGLRIDERVLDITLADDMTFEGTLRVVTTVTGAAGLADAQQASLSYDPATHELELVSAKVVEPDGTVHVVDDSRVFERPSDVAQGAPGYVSAVTTSVLFPQLRVGSQTHVEWRFAEHTRGLIGFTHAWRPSFALPVTEARIRIRHPASVPLRFHADEPFRVASLRDGDEVLVEATLRDYAGQVPQRAMVAPGDVVPRFVASTHPSWESLGALLHEAVTPQVQVTPEIEALAARIVGERQGLDAARAIHRWVCENIQYVVLYLNQGDHWVPHPAGEVLAAGYGDCKDKHVVSASLLAAVGIEAVPVLVNYDRGFEPYALPTPLQFNHCMTYLPAFDLYSNPTDPYRDLGDLDTTLSDKLVVLGTPEGRTGRTPVSRADDNRYHLTQTSVIGMDGSVTGRSVLGFTGRTSGMLRRTLARSADPHQAADGLLHAGALGGSGNLVTSAPTDLDAPLRCEGTWTGDIPLEMSSTIRFATPDGLDLANAALMRDFLTSEERRYPILIAAIDLEWRHELQLPHGYALDGLPEGRRVQTRAGVYESEYALTDAGHVTIRRHLRIEQDRFPADHAADLRALLLAALMDRQTILSASIRT